MLRGAGADVDVRNGSGDAPLHLAAQSGQADAIKAVLEADADPGASDDAGRTPLFAGVTRNSDESFVALIEGGASVEVHDLRGAAQSREAVQCCGSEEISKEFLAAGADPDAKDSFEVTPIFYESLPSMVSVLVAAGGPVHVRDARQDGAPRGGAMGKLARDNRGSSGCVSGPQRPRPPGRAGARPCRGPGELNGAEANRRLLSQ